MTNALLPPSSAGIAEPVKIRPRTASGCQAMSRARLPPEAAKGSVVVSTGLSTFTAVRSLLCVFTTIAECLVDTVPGSTATPFGNSFVVTVNGGWARSFKLMRVSEPRYGCPSAGT